MGARQRAAPLLTTGNCPCLRDNAPAIRHGDNRRREPPAPQTGSRRHWPGGVEGGGSEIAQIATTLRVIEGVVGIKVAV